MHAGPLLVQTLHNPVGRRRPCRKIGGRAGTRTAHPHCRARRAPGDAQSFRELAPAQTDGDEPQTRCAFTRGESPAHKAQVFVRLSQLLKLYEYPVTLCTNTTYGWMSLFAPRHTARRRPTAGRSPTSMSLPRGMPAYEKDHVKCLAKPTEYLTSLGPARNSEGAKPEAVHCARSSIFQRYALGVGRTRPSPRMQLQRWPKNGSTLIRRASGLKLKIPSADVYMLDR